MDFIIEPYEGVEVPGKGVIRFDMTRKEVRGFFDEEPRTRVFQEDGEDYPHDQYCGHSISFTFDPAGALYRIVGMKGVRLFLDDDLLGNLDYDDLFKLVQTKDPDLASVKQEGCKSLVLGLVVFSEGLILKRPPQGIMMYRRGRKELLR